MSARANLVDLAEYRTPEEQKQAVLAKVGDLSELTVLGDLVIVSLYVKPNRSKGGILFADKTVEEDRYQSKCGLVLQVGPTAFKYDGPYVWGKWTDADGIDHHATPPKVGDWVMFRAADGWDQDIKGIACRMVHSDLIKAIVTDPAVIY